MYKQQKTQRSKHKEGITLKRWLLRSDSKLKKEEKKALALRNQKRGDGRSGSLSLYPPIYRGGGF